MLDVQLSELDKWRIVNREKAIKKIIRKLKRVIWLQAGTGAGAWAWAVKDAKFEQKQLEDMIRQAIETDRDP